MPKITKHAEFLETLRTMVTKEATAGTVTGKPGADTHYTAVSKETEHVNKNEQGHPEKNPQDFKQEASKDKSDPTKKHSEEQAAEVEKEAKAAPAGAAQLPDTGKPEVAKDATNKTCQKAAEEKPEEKAAEAKPEEKKAEEKAAEAKPEEKKAEEKPEENLKLAELGKQLLDAIKQAQAAPVEKSAEMPKATGKPGADTHPASVSKSTEHVNKNEQGRPENNPQEFKQEKGKDAPLHAGKKAEDVSQEDLDKQASFELGRQFCRSFLQTKVAGNTEVYKEAGRRDFETLIAQAAAELEQEQKQAVQKQASVVYDEAQAEKLAEEQGAQAFYAMMKQAQEEYQAEQIKQAFDQRISAVAAEKEAALKKAAELEAKLAEKEAAIQKKAEEEKRAQEFHTWGQYVVNEMMDRLSRESSK